MQRSATASPVRSYALAWTAAALLALVLGAPSLGDGTTEDWTIAGLLLVVATVGNLIDVPLRFRGFEESTSLVELGLVPAMLLLPTGLATVVAATAGLVSGLVGIRDSGGARVLKAAFNASWMVVAVAVGGAVFRLLGGVSFSSGPDDVAAAIGAALVLVVVNQGAIIGLVVKLAPTTTRRVIADYGLASWLVNATVAVTGVLVTLLGVAAPYAIPLLLLPGWVVSDRLRARSEAFEVLAAQQEEFALTVAAASDGIVLLGDGGRVRVWNPAMAGLTGVSEEEAVGRTLVHLGMQDLLPAGTDDQGVREWQGSFLEVRRNLLPAGDGGALLTVRDMSRETELQQLREDFVARISHELRTPVATVSGFVETLDRRWDQLPSDARRELVHAADRGARRLWTLVENVLAWSRIEHRAAQTMDERADVQWSPVRPAVDDVVEAIGAGSVVVDIADGGEVPLAPEDLRLVLRNLLDNARTYGQPPVEVQLERTPTTVELSVVDHGDGVDPAVADELLAPFRQLTSGPRRTDRGLGLGLAVVRATVAVSGGITEFVSGDGTTTIRVTWPVKSQDRSD